MCGHNGRSNGLCPNDSKFGNLILGYPSPPHRHKNTLSNHYDHRHFPYTTQYGISYIFLLRFVVNNTSSISHCGSPTLFPRFIVPRRRKSIDRIGFARAGMVTIASKAIQPKQTSCCCLSSMRAPSRRPLRALQGMPSGSSSSLSSSSWSSSSSQHQNALLTLLNKMRKLELKSQQRGITPLSARRWWRPNRSRPRTFRSSSRPSNC